MTFTKRQRTIGFKLESTPYTAETLGGGDYDFRARDIECGPEIEEYKRLYATGDYGAFNSIMGKRKGTVSFAVDMAPSGTNTTPPEWGKILKACAVSETIGGSNVTYKGDAQENNTPATIEIVDRDEGSSPTQVVTKLAGCMGNGRIIMDSLGQPVRLEVEFQGRLVSITDRESGSLITPSGFDNTLPDAVLSSTLTLFGEAQPLDKVTLDFGNDIQMALDPSSSDGYKGAYVVNRLPTLQIDPHLDTIANRGNYARWTGNTTGAFSMSVGSNVVISAPCAQIIKGYDGADRDGFTVNTIDCILTRTSDTDETDFQIVTS